MLDFQLAPFIIAGLLVVTGYMFSRWLSNLGELRHWKAITESLADNIDAMQEEGCAAMGALQNIFNGVTASGVPISPTMRRVADIAAKTLHEASGCDHKAQAEDNEGRIEHAIIRAESWERIADRLADEQIVAKQNINNLRLVAQEAVGRAHEAERLLGLANDKLIVAESQRADSTPSLPYERGDVPEADD